MLMEGKILRDVTTKNIPSFLGAPIDKIQKGEIIRITDINTKQDGTWYYVPTSGWIKARDIQITQDISFNIKAKKANILDLQRFAGGLLGGGLRGLTSDDNALTMGRIAGVAIAGGGCFGQPGPIGGLGSLGGIGSITGGINGNTKIGGALNTFGIGLGGSLGKAIGNQSIGSLFDGSFLGNVIGDMLGSMFDKLFSSFFKRLSFVVGFDVEGLLSQLYAPIGSVNQGTADTLIKSLVKGYNNTHEYTYIDYAAEAYFDYLGCAGGAHKTGTSQVLDPGGYLKGISFGLYNEDIKNATRQEFEDTIKYTVRDVHYPIDQWGGKGSTMDFTTPQFPMGTKNQEEVSFNEALWNTTYDDFKDVIGKVKTTLNLNITRSDWLINFNRHRLTHPDYHLTASQAHVFLTRPDLNIFGDSYESMNGSIDKTGDGPFFQNAIQLHKAEAMSLTSSFSGAHDFIPMITNCVRSLDLQDTSIDTIEHGETLTKWKLVYAKDIIKSMTSGSFSMSFVDDYKLSISYLHLIWLYYMNGVSRGIIAPTDAHVKNGIIDYASSLYYILTDATGENIIFWSKYWGVFPTNYPSSAFSLSDGNMVKTPDVTIQYSYSFKKDMDPLILAEFNKNAKGSGFNYVPVYNEHTFRCNQTIVGPPFVELVTNKDTNEKIYKLRWRAA